MEAEWESSPVYKKCVTLGKKKKEVDREIDQM